jgi:hypothetical protein
VHHALPRSTCPPSCLPPLFHSVFMHLTFISLSTLPSFSFFEARSCYVDPGWPGTCFVVQADLKLETFLLQPPNGLGLQMCIITPSSPLYLLFFHTHVFISLYTFVSLGSPSSCHSPHVALITQCYTHSALPTCHSFTIHHSDH